MTRWFDTYAALLLSFILVVASQGQAHARGLTGPDGQLVICAGNGPVMVVLDADGMPISDPYICPDCALSLIQASVDQPVDSERGKVARQIDFLDADVCAEDRAKLIAHSRDPPSVSSIRSTL